MTFRVEITAEAERDLDSISAWLISQHPGATGSRWFEALEGAVASLEALPERCPVAPESRLFPFEVRQLLYGNKPHVYRVLFTVQRARFMCFTSGMDGGSLFVDETLPERDGMPSGWVRHSLNQRETGC